MAVQVMAKLHIAELSLQLIEAFRPIMARIKRCDRGLADQLQRAASSCALNLAEGELSDPGNRRARFFYGGGQRECVARGFAGRNGLGLHHARGCGYRRELVPPHRCRLVEAHAVAS
jgi:hypothetical protein